MKRVIGVYRNQNTHWVGDGLPVRNLFSYDRLGQAISPFLLLDYGAPHKFEPTQQQLGVGSHPHRGFETVTIAYQGSLAHKDSSGGGGIIESGDVQWMTAGSGLVHEEFHSPEFAKNGGVLEMAQLWVNLPAKDKMTKPRYQALSAADIPTIHMDDDAGYIRVIAGEFGGHHGSADTFSPINVWDGKLKAEYETVLHVPVDHNALLVVLKGEVVVNESQKILDSSIVMFARDAEAEIKLQAYQDTQFLVLTGKPLNEPIQGHGPFVMNTKEEILQAFHDFNKGKFGEIVAD